MNCRAIILKWQWAGSGHHPAPPPKTIHGEIVMRPRKQIGLGLLTLVFGLVLTMPGCTEGKKEVGLKFADCPRPSRRRSSTTRAASNSPLLTKRPRRMVASFTKLRGRRPTARKSKIKVAADGRLVEFKDEGGD